MYTYIYIYIHTRIYTYIYIYIYTYCYTYMHIYTNPDNDNIPSKPWTQIPSVGIRVLPEVTTDFGYEFCFEAPNGSVKWYKARPRLAVWWRALIGPGSWLKLGWRWMESIFELVKCDVIKWLSHVQKFRVISLVFSAILCKMEHMSGSHSFRTAARSQVSRIFTWSNHRNTIGNHRKTRGKWWFYGIWWDLPSGNDKHSCGLNHHV